MKDLMESFKKFLSEADIRKELVRQLENKGIIPGVVIYDYEFGEPPQTLTIEAVDESGVSWTESGAFGKGHINLPRAIEAVNEGDWVPSTRLTLPKYFSDVDPPKSSRLQDLGIKEVLENWRSFMRLNEAINPATIEKIESVLAQAGGESYIVGGAIRDELLPDTPPSKDIDFLVRGLPLSNIANALAPLGKVSEVGQAFGVVTAIIDGEEFDFAIPRTAETKTGEKHTEFDVQTDPNAPVETDLGRRDFTINALAKDSSGNIIDMFGGQEDIQNKIIRAVGNAEDRFSEDPLRMLRAIQFATRFNFDIEPETAEAIKKNINKIDTIAAERVLMEFNKAWTKGSQNIEKMVKLLEDTGMGKQIFGKEFDPVVAKIDGDIADKIVGNFIAFFLNGGDHTAMKPTNEMVKYLSLAKEAKENRKEVYEYASGQRDRLPIIAIVLRQAGMEEQADKIEKALEHPLSAKELDIGGRELTQMGLRGPEIGQAMRSALEAIHAGKLNNTYDEIARFLQV